MEWSKAGRPRTKPRRNKYVARWTKAERSIIAATEYAGDVMLAIAVVRQWIKDGKPEADFPAIKIWLNIIQQSYAKKNKKIFQDEQVVAYAMKFGLRNEKNVRHKP